MVDVIDAKRDHVPSQRELDLGLTDYEFRPLPPADDAKVSARQRLAAMVEQLDPRIILREGPGLPLLLLFLISMIAFWDESAFGVLLKEIQRSFHFDLSYLLVLGSLVQAVTFLIAPLMGFLADRVSRVKMVAVGAFLGSAAVLGTGVAPSVAAVTGAWAVDGLGLGVVQPANYPLVTDWYPYHIRARVFAVLGIGASFGLLIGPTVTGALGSLLGWRAAFLVLAVLPFAVGVGFLFLKEPIRGGLDRKEMGADDEAAAREQAPVGLTESYRAARSITSLRRIWYAAPFLTAASTILNTLLLLYFADTFGISAFERGLIGSLTGVVGLIGLAFSGPLADRLLANKPARVFTLLGGLLFLNCFCIVALLYVPVLWMAVVVAAPLGIGIAAALPALFTLTSVVVPARIRAFGLQTVAPWQVLGLFLVVILGELGKAANIRGALFAVIPVFAIGAVVIGSAGAGVDRDIRVARAVSMADEEARRAKAEGKNKMLICRDVDVTYEGTQVLFHVDLDIEEGELIVVLGTNGAGKSTLLRAICGLQEASNGAIFLDGEDVTHRPAYLNAAGGVVFMPGGQSVFPTLTVAENLRAAGWLYRNSDDDLDGRLREVLELFPRLQERMGDKAGNLSGGEQQMVALGQAFLMRPRLLMIDELSLGLAPAVVEQLLEVVRRVNANGTTVVLVEQSVNVALTIANRAIFLDKGEIRFDGPTKDLLDRADLVRSVFLGSPASAGPALAAGGPLLRKPGDAPVDPVEVLAASGIAVSFGGRAALDGADATVNAGDVLGIIGPNGAGKTTLFDVISGYVRPDAGTVMIAGQDVAGLSPDARARCGLGRSFQNARMFASLTVRENIAVALELHLKSRSALAAATWLPAARQSERRAFRRVEYLVDLLQLDAYADKFAGELSTGTRRMVDVACIMAAEPRLLLLDEPSSGLAQAEVEVFAPVVRRLARETGCGVLVIEHDLPLVTALSDRLLAMELGRVIAEGRPDDVIADPEVVRAYLGVSQATIQRSGSSLSAALAAAGLTPDGDVH